MAPPKAEDLAYAGDEKYERLTPFQSARYELHGVVGFQNCKQMEQRFQNEGRKVWLSRAVPNPSKGILKWVCIFEGDDVNPLHFQDNRYNSPQEYQYP